MCGICGFTGAPDPERLARMLALLEHRGPDDEGVHETPAGSVGARRLAIIDVQDGHQPALSEDGSVAAVLNGEIYNHRELREWLQRRGHRLRSGSDTEVLPHLYEELGPALTTMVEGMFALAIWDGARERLVLARDRAGEKPLLWARSGAGVVFASELRALLAGAGVPRNIDPAALRLYLALQYVPGPRTIVEGVEKLPPGHRLVAERGTVTVERYWDVAGSDPSQLVSLPGAERELRALLEDAVAAQREADVPVGALLSGGVDSAGIVALLARGRPEPVRTFTVGFDHPGLDEREPARAVARALGTDHTELVVGAPSFEQLRTMVRHLDEPVADQAALPTYLIAKVASEHVKVVLTGEGSDELFGGYPRYRWSAAAERLGRLALPLHHAARAVPHARRRRQADLLLAPRSPLARHLAWVGVFDPVEAGDLLAEPYAGGDPAEAERALAAALDGAAPRDALEQEMLVDLKTWLVDDILTKADRMSMAASIEARAPYLDRRVVEFATSLPAEARVRGRETKPLLRAALRGALPEPVLRRRKAAFRVPVESWLASGFDARLRELLLAPDAATGDVLRKDAVERVLADGGERAARQAWALGVLELWMREVGS